MPPPPLHAILAILAIGIKDETISVSQITRSIVQKLGAIFSSLKSQNDINLVRWCKSTLNPDENCVPFQPERLKVPKGKSRLILAVSETKLRMKFGECALRNP